MNDSFTIGTVERRPKLKMKCLASELTFDQGVSPVLVIRW